MFPNKLSVRFLFSKIVLKNRLFIQVQGEHGVQQPIPTPNGQNDLNQGNSNGQNNVHSNQPGSNHDELGQEFQDILNNNGQNQPIPTPTIGQGNGQNQPIPTPTIGQGNGQYQPIPTPTIGQGNGQNQPIPIPSIGQGGSVNGQNPVDLDAPGAEFGLDVRQRFALCETIEKKKIVYSFLGKN